MIQSCNRTLLLAAFGWLAFPVFADEPDEVENQESAPEQVVAEDAELTPLPVLTSKATPADQVDPFQLAIEQIEIEYGVYDTQLIPALKALARNARNQGEYAHAHKAASRALHLHRINEGLFDIEQAPIVEELIALHIEQNHWGRAHESHDYLFNLYSRNFGVGSSRLLPVIDDLVDSHIRLYDWRQRTGQRDSRHLLRSFQLNSHGLAIAQSQGRLTTMELASLLRKQALISYLLADYTLTEIVLKKEDRRVVQQTGVDIAELTRPGQDSVEHINAYATGKQALEQRIFLLQSDSSVSLVDRVQAMAELGDWYLLFAKRNAATKAYQEAYQLSEKINQASANQSESAEQVSLFSKPHVLAFHRPLDTFIKQQGGLISEKPEQPLAGYQQGLIEARFDVSAFGKVKNIEIVQANPEGLKEVALKRSLKATRFRPRLAAGEVAATEGAVYRHVFSYKPEDFDE